ncbi:EF0163 family protein [Enterococcus faecalis]|uniref:EF0163 family protein n=1 Tax=Enterococcus faecalis TaxID=1351 RepID=UPI00403F3D18
MKNYVVKAGIGVAVFLLVCIGSIQIYTKYQGKKAEEEKPISLKSSSETFSKESSEQSEKEQISQQDYDTFLQDFGEKFLNYSSIDERNKSVRDMFTGEARAINGLDTSVDINVEGKGKVKAIYRQTTEEMKYVIVGTDEVNGNKNGIVLFVELMDKNGETKISQLTVSYIRQAY